MPEHRVLLSAIRRVHPLGLTQPIDADTLTRIVNGPPMEGVTTTLSVRPTDHSDIVFDVTLHVTASEPATTKAAGAETWTIKATVIELKAPSGYKVPSWCRVGSEIKGYVAYAEAYPGPGVLLELVA